MVIIYLLVGLLLWAVLFNYESFWVKWLALIWFTLLWLPIVVIFVVLASLKLY